MSKRGHEEEAVMNPAAPDETKEKRPGVDRHGRKVIWSGAIGMALQLAILLAAAGRLWWMQAWVLTAFHSFFYALHIVVLVKVNPELLNERGKFMKPGTKSFDKVLLPLWRLTTLAVLVVAGLDAVRFQWSSMPAWTMAPGLVLSLPAWVLTVWAPAVNRHFETTVRIQTDRNHRVCASGPYRFVRHPVYLAMIIVGLTTPLILGSFWAFAPTALLVAAVAARTAMEDRTLRKELEGYRDYAEKITRYRLFPLLW